MTYEVILADPPWHYANRKTGGERKNKTRFGGGAQKHYPLMRDSELLAMANFVSSRASDNAALFLWTTYPRLDFGIEVLKAWGFRFATVAYTWVKTVRDGSRPVYGPGTYTASNPEIVLLGVKGSITSMIGQKMQPSVIISPRMEHSRKPDEVRQRIIDLMPDARRIELFARTAFDGYEVWGQAFGNEFKEVKTNG